MASATFTGTLLKTDATAFASTTVTAYRLASPDVQAVANSADPVSATTDASGVYSLTLYRHASYPIPYKLVYPNGSTAIVVVGQNDATMNLGIVQIPASPYRRDLTQVVRDNMERYRNGIITQNTTVATTSNTDYLFVAPFSGTLASVQANTGTTLAANDTNYVTFSVTNITNSNAAMLAATDPNTTKATGGSAWTASTVRSHTLNGTAANLLVAQGDVIRVRYAVTGTLGGALSTPSTLLRFTN